MKDKIQWYAGQTVSSTDMQAGVNDGLEDTERAHNIDAGHSQALAAATPDPTVYGGIKRGLAVTGVVGNDYVSVALGQCYDYLGRCIEGLTATVKVTYTGNTAIAAVALATGTGASIALSCPFGNRVVVSLFAAYGELETNQVQDETLTWLYKNQAESFRFDLQVGTSFVAAAPPVLAPFAALADGKVLLADILVENSGGNLQVVAICTESLNWDALGGNYAGWVGRRADWLVAEVDDANLPQQFISFREGTTRGFLYTLLQNLQNQAVGLSGTNLIGSDSQSSTVWNRVSGPVTLIASRLSSQIWDIAHLLSAALYTGGGNTLQPQGNYNGLVFEPADMNDSRAGYVIKALQDAGAANFLRIGKKRGHISIPNVLYEDWLRYGGATSGVYAGRVQVNLTGSGWTHATTGTGELLFATADAVGSPIPGGAVAITENGVNTGVLRYGWEPTGTNRFAGWKVDASPWAIIEWRVNIGVVANMYMSFSFGDGGNSGVTFYVDTGVSNNLMLTAFDSGGAFVTNASYGAWPTNTWLTVRCAFIANNKVAWQINNGTEIVQTVAGTFSGNLHYPSATLRGLVVGVRDVYIDEVLICSGGLPTDKW